MTFGTAAIVVCSRCFSAGELARLAVGAGWWLFEVTTDEGPHTWEMELCPSCAEAFRQFMGATPKPLPATEGVAS